MKYLFIPTLALMLAASGAHAEKKDAAQAKAVKKVVNAAASLLVELTKEDESAGKKKAGKPPKKAGKTTEQETAKGAAAKQAAAKKAAAKKAAKAGAPNGAEIEADPVDIEADPVDIEADPVDQAALAQQEAQAIYGTRCVACHGVSGRGDGPGAPALNPRPRDYTNKVWLKNLSDDVLSRAIVEGGASIGESALMPPNPDLRAKPEVVKALVSMIRSF